MTNFLLTKSSLILCPHGGMVTHVPMSYSTELINGELPMLMNDQYFVVGCPFIIGDMISSCFRVIWTTASAKRLINGIPVLTNTSVGLCQSAQGIPQGVAMIAVFQTMEQE